MFCSNIFQKKFGFHGYFVTTRWLLLIDDCSHKNAANKYFIIIINCYVINKINIYIYSHKLIVPSKVQIVYFK